MKKYLVVALAALFVLGFAASSFAIHAEIPAETQAVVAKSATQITIGGELRFRGDYRANTRDFNNDSQGTNDQAYYDARVRLQVEAKVTPNTTGLIQLETSGGSADNYVWGAPASGVTSGIAGSVQVGNQKQSGLYILQAWVLHQGTGLLGVPALVKVGHMPITIGTGLFYNHDYQGDDAILVGVDPVKGLHLILGTVKDKEGVQTLNDDTTGYALLLNYDINKDSSIGLDVTYVDSQNGSAALGQIDAIPVANIAALASPHFDIHFWNIGLNGKTKIAGLGLYGEFDLQTGKVVDTGAAVGDVKFRGFAGKAGVTYTLAPVSLGLEFAYGSGDDSADDKLKTFITSQGQVQHFTYVYDYRTVNAANNAFGGLQNTWYIKASGAADITKALSANLDVYYLQAAKEIKTFTVNGATVHSYGFANASDSKNIGLEVDAKANYKIDRNLNYFVEGGYLFAGNFWKAVTGPNVSPDDAWVVRHGIQLSF